MQFNVTNAPSTFQGWMNELFRPCLRKFVLVFFYDILVYSRSWEEHLQHLGVVLEMLKSNQLVAKQSKCHFGVTQVEYLGHVISSSGVGVDPTKIRTVLQWPTPTTVKSFRAFLGLTDYYRKFIRGFGSIAAPLTRLLSKDGFHWTSETVAAFNQLKQALTSPPVLRLPDFNQPFVIECDTYITGLSWVNHLGAMCNQWISTPTQLRWLPKILEYDYIIQYK
ncbi:hypothetical protein ACOSQ3_005187 [Xanthoceras sorbifolium]